MTARRRLEIASYGIDEFKQTFFSDPFGSISWLGMRVPTLSTTALASANATAPYQNRYLFLGAAFSVAEGSRCRVIGYRQYAELGIPLAVTGEGGGFTRPILLPVTTPGWCFPDATTTWHFRRLGGSPNAAGLPSFRPSNPTDLVNLRRGFGMTPALLYQSVTLPAGDAFYPDLTAYVPPNGGRPFGAPLTDDPRLSNLYGLQTEWKTADAWESLDLEVRGPDTVCAFISTAQSDPSSRPRDPSTGFGAGSLGIGIAPEDAFLANGVDIYETPAILWRVGVSLIVEVDSLESEIRAVVGGERRTG